MLDIKLIREHPEIVKENIKRKDQKSKLKLVDEIILKDSNWRTLKGKVDTLRADRNKISREISEAKKAGKSATALLKKAKDIPAEIEKVEKKRRN